MNHLAAAFEDDSVIDSKARCVNITFEDGWSMDFHPVFGSNGSVNVAADDHRARFNLAVDSGRFAHDECIRREDVPSKRSADADRSLKAEFSLEFTAVLNDGSY